MLLLLAHLDFVVDREETKKKKKKKSVGVCHFALEYLPLGLICRDLLTSPTGAISSIALRECHIKLYICYGRVRLLLISLSYGNARCRIAFNIEYLFWRRLKELARLYAITRKLASYKLVQNNANKVRSDVAIKGDHKKGTSGESAATIKGRSATGQPCEGCS